MITFHLQGKRDYTDIFIDGIPAIGFQQTYYKDVFSYGLNQCL